MADSTEKISYESPTFKLLIFVNVGLFLLTLLVMVLLASLNPENSYARDVYETCETICKMSAGAFIGLLGGRAAVPKA